MLHTVSLYSSNTPTLNQKFLNLMGFFNLKKYIVISSEFMFFPCHC